MLLWKMVIGMQTMTVRNQNLSDLNPLNCGWQDCEPGHSYGPAYREHYLLHYILSGEGIFQRQGQQLHLREGQLFLIRPGERTFYQADPMRPWSYVWLGFQGARCEEFLSLGELPPGVCWANAPFLQSLFEKLKNDISHGGIDELSLCACLYSLFSMLRQKQTAAVRRGDYIAQTLDFMHANYALPISIEGIAKMIGINRRYLSKLFAEEMSQTPKQYLVDLRLEKAKSLLLEKNSSVYEVARSVGYEDVYNFSKMFKKKYGLAPMAYKRISNG